MFSLNVWQPINFFENKNKKELWGCRGLSYMEYTQGEDKNQGFYFSFRQNPANTQWTHMSSESTLCDFQWS